MFRSYARLAPQLLRAVLQRSDDVPPISRIRTRVPLDHIDVFGHMNQARYAEHFEIGRTDLVVRTGAWSRWRAAGVYPVVARQEITYRRELKPLQRFTMDTRGVGMDGRLWHTRGTMLVGDRVHAVDDVFLIFVGPEGVLDADGVRPHVEALNIEPLPVEDWSVLPS